MNIRTFIFLLCGLSSIIYGQNHFCECCSHGFEAQFEKVLDKDAIKKLGITELMVYTSSTKTLIEDNDTTFVQNGPSYTEMTFKFNAGGYVTSRTMFYAGKYNHIIEYARDSKNKIVSQSMYYLDSLGRKTTMEPWYFWRYDYKGDLLIKQKQIQGKYKFKPDKLGHYLAFEYNKEGKLTKEITHLYWDKESVSHYESTTMYNSAANLSLRFTKDGDSLMWYQVMSYDSSGHPTNEKFYDGRTGKLLLEHQYSYNAHGFMTEDRNINAGMGTECPANYVDRYFYNNQNLLTAISYIVEETYSCDMHFIYR